MRFKQLIGENVEKQKISTVKATKFQTLINSYRLNEQTADDPNAAAMQDAALDPSLAQTQTAQAAPAPEQPEVEALIPEGEVELIRLLRKALLLDVDENSVPTDLTSVDINQNNAREIYKQIKDFMSTFTE